MVSCLSPAACGFGKSLKMLRKVFVKFRVLRVKMNISINHNLYISMKHLLLSLILFPLAMQAQIDQFYQENANANLNDATQATDRIEQRTVLFRPENSEIHLK